MGKVTLPVADVVLIRLSEGELSISMSNFGSRLDGRARSLAADLRA